jgi:hypothetical protein
MKWPRASIARTIRPGSVSPGTSGGGAAKVIAQRESAPSTPSAGGSSRPCAISRVWMSRGEDGAGGGADSLDGASGGVARVNKPASRRKKAAPRAADISAMADSFSYRTRSK